MRVLLFKLIMRCIYLVIYLKFIRRIITILLSLATLIAGRFIGTLFWLLIERAISSFVAK